MKAGSGYQTVDAYLEAQPEPVRDRLQQVRRTIRMVLPDAQEVVSYQMPAYVQDGRIVVYFAGWKEHYALYPVTAPVVAALGEAIAGYEIGKGTIRFPLGKRVPVALIRRITNFLAQAAAERAAARRKQTRKGR